MVGAELVQQPAVVRDRQDTEALLVGRRLDAAADGPERVHVEARVDLGEHGDLRRENSQLQRLVALPLAPRPHDEADAVQDVATRHAGPQVSDDELAALAPRYHADTRPGALTEPSPRCCRPRSRPRTRGSPSWPAATAAHR